uniref:(northern house mosquito) hypothetical protein n=1 Tax=Culex pipiens TaxID=7175 RepID=A0A8D8AHL2_CULPI
MSTLAAVALTLDHATPWISTHCSCLSVCFCSSARRRCLAISSVSSFSGTFSNTKRSDEFGKDWNRIVTRSVSSSFFFRKRSDVPSSIHLLQLQSIHLLPNTRFLDFHSGVSVELPVVITHVGWAIHFSLWPFLPHQ